MINLYHAPADDKPVKTYEFTAFSVSLDSGPSIFMDVSNGAYDLKEQDEHWVGRYNKVPSEDYPF